MEDARFLGIDYGESRIGLALSDPLKTFSYSYKTIKNDKSLWQNITVIINTKNITKVVLGMPDAKRNKDLVDKILSFKNKIETKFKLEVITWNEEFTSSIAQERIIQSVAKKKKRKDKGLIDRNSAAIILEEYLNSL
ncbi:MAG: Holliday junction resolvase RuvX [Ignavibacterium sp.]|nr:MAG: Holliday junction resolvase RuvX [Ignavibacterium sp.]